jgi:hypothetical protein
MSLLLSTLAPGENVVANGDFSVWDKYTGKGITVTSVGVSRETFLKDWYGGPGVGATATYDVVDIEPGQTEVPGKPKRHLRIAWQTAPTAGETQHGNAFRMTFLEYFGIQDVRIFSGKTVAFSFHARIVSKDPAAALEIVPIMWHSYDPAQSARGKGYELFEASGKPGVVAVVQGAPNPNAAVTLTTKWQLFEKRITLPDVSDKTITSGHYTGVGFDLCSTSAPTIDIANVEVRALQ